VDMSKPEGLLPPRPQIEQSAIRSHLRTSKQYEPPSASQKLLTVPAAAGATASTTKSSTEVAPERTTSKPILEVGKKKSMKIEKKKSKKSIVPQAVPAGEADAAAGQPELPVTLPSMESIDVMLAETEGTANRIPSRSAREIVVDLRSWECKEAVKGRFLPTLHSNKKGRSVCKDEAFSTRRTRMTRMSRKSHASTKKSKVEGGDNIQKPQTVSRKSWLPETKAAEYNFKQKLFLILDKPTSSKAAQMWFGFMAICIIISTSIIFLKPMIYKYEDKVDEDHKPTWLGLELFFTLLFTLELFVRFAVCDAFESKGNGHGYWQAHRRFVQSPPNICDLLSVMPTYMDLLILGGEKDGNGMALSLLKIARLFRLFKVARMARLTKKWTFMGPTAAVLTIVWGIYLKEYAMKKQK